MDEQISKQRQVLQILERYHIRECSVDSNGVVDVYNNNVVFTHKEMTSIPVQFRSVEGYFDCSGTGMVSLAGSPSKVGKYYDCSRTQTTSLAHAPQIVNGGFHCQETKITSLTGVHKIIKEVNGMFIAPNATHLLGLLLIKGVTFIRVDDNTPITLILNKYLRTQDVFLAQDELIDAGFIEQAKL